MLDKSNLRSPESSIPHYVPGTVLIANKMTVNKTGCVLDLYLWDSFCVKGERKGTELKMVLF